MDNYDSRGAFPITLRQAAMCVCVANDRPESFRLDLSETGTSMIHQCRTLGFLLSVVTALGHFLDVTVPCHVHVHPTFLSVP